MDRIFFGGFSSLTDIIEEFEIESSELEGCKVLFAWYDIGGYDGGAHLLFEKNKKLYEVNGGHCSCHGLEAQWSPEETTFEALAERGWNYYTKGNALDALKNLVETGLTARKKDKKKLNVYISITLQTD